MESDNLKTVLVKLASFCHQLSENQTDLARILLKEIPSLSKESQDAARGIVEHNEKLRDAIGDVGRDLAAWI
jgi:hypothetical protein